MDRNREARRASIVGSNGFNRRRHRTNSLRDSPDEDGGVELQESVRLRERVKKDRDRERDLRERERDLRERPSRNNHDNNKRRRAERLTDETSDESVNDDEDEEDEDHRTAAAAAVPKMLLTQPAGSVLNHGHGHGGNHHNSSSSQHHHQQNNNCSSSNNNNMMNSSNNQQHLQHRKSFPPASSSSATKVFRAPPVWKSGDEMIGVPVPRKARSASTKRSHDWISSSSNNNSGGGGISGGEQQIPRQPSSSPVRQGLVSTPLPAAPMSPSSSNVSIRKKLKPSVNNSGPKLKPPKSKPSSLNPEELEIEIAEVLYGLMTQSQGPSSKKEDSREVNRSRNSSPISNSTSGNNNLLGSNSTPLSAVAPKRKRPRHIPENSSYGARGSPVSAKPEMDQMLKSEISSPTLEKVSGSTAENGIQMGGNLVNSRAPAPASQPPEQPTLPASTKLNSELKATEELGESSNLAVKEEVNSPKEKESPAVTAPVATTTIKSSSAVPEMENQRAEKFEIDLMAPPPERETDTNVREAQDDQKPVLSINDTEMKSVKEDSKGKRPKDNSSNDEKKCKSTGEEGELHKNSTERNIDLRLDLEKFERDENCEVIANGTKLQMQAQKPPIERSGQSTNPMPLPISMANWPGGLPPMGYMTPLQGVVSMDGTTVTPAPIQPLFTQPRPKRCATHCHIARNIYYIQQFTKMNPFWPANPGSASLFGSKPCNLNVMPDLHGNIAVKGVNNAPQDKGQRLANIHNHVSKDKISQPTNSQDSAQRKQQILIQQTIPPVPPNNLLGPAFIFPLNQQQAAIAAATRPSGGKSQATVVAPASSGGGASTTSAPGGGVHFNFPTMAANETQYLAILQNNGYPFPIPTVGAPPNYRAAPGQAVPMFNGSFYSSQMIHPPPTQPPPQLLQAHTSGSNNSSSSQKQHSQRPQSGNNGGPGNSNLQNFSAQKSSHNQNEPGSEDSPSNASRASMNIYGPNFAMPIHNFALMAQQASNNGNQTEKKPLKAGVDSIMPPQSFAMSFGPGVDMASLAQNHAIFQASSESTRQNIQMMDDERKRQNANVGQSIAFTRSDSPVTTSVQTSNAIEGPTRSLNPASGPARGPRPTSSNVNAHYQAQLQQQQMMQQFKQQQQQQMAVNRSKDHVNSSSSSMAAKFPNALTGFPQNLVPGNSNSPSQSKAPNSQSPSNATSLKNLPQQHSTRTQPQMHTQISFGNQKPSTPSQGQAGNSSNRALSPPMVVNSPTTSSMSKGASNSPRSTNPASSNNKSSPSIHAHTQKSPPSILGNPHTSSNSSTSKPQIQQQHTKALQHPLSHPFFSNPYAWAQPSHSKGTNSTNSGYMQRRRPEQHQQSPGGAQTMSSTRDLSLSTTSTNDPAKAIAAATCNVKGIIHASQFADAQSSGTLLPAGFSYAVQAKPAEQKQPNGNDNLHVWQPEKK